MSTPYHVPALSVAPGKRFIPCYSPGELEERQLAGVRWTLAHALTGSPQYRAKLGDAHPGDIRTLDDVRKLPFTTTEDLRAGYPLPLLSVPDTASARYWPIPVTT